MQHELGHAMGIPHTNNANSLMFPRLHNSNQKFSRKDITTFREVFGQEPLSTRSINRLLSGESGEDDSVTQRPATRNARRQTTPTAIITSKPTRRRQKNQSRNRVRLNNKNNSQNRQPRQRIQYYFRTANGLVPISLLRGQNQVRRSNKNTSARINQVVEDPPTTTHVITTDMPESATLLGFVSTTETDTSTTPPPPREIPADAPLALPPITPLDAVIPPSVSLIVSHVVNAKLIQMSTARDWNGQISLFPSLFGTSNRFMLVGRRHGLELVDTRKGEPMLINESE